MSRKLDLHKTEYYNQLKHEKHQTDCEEKSEVINEDIVTNQTVFALEFNFENVPMIPLLGISNLSVDRKSSN